MSEDKTIDPEIVNLSPDLLIDVQRITYLLLEEWISEARSSIEILSEARERLADAIVYGSFTDVARLAQRASEDVRSAVDAILKVTGQLDSPASISMLLDKKYNRDSEDSVMENLNPGQRARIAQVFKALAQKVETLSDGE